jgi:hypothetical protein
LGLYEGVRDDEINENNIIIPGIKNTKKEDKKFIEEVDQD